MSRHAKHRAQRARIVWKYELAYLSNRWHAFIKPAIKRALKGDS